MKSHFVGRLTVDTGPAHRALGGKISVGMLFHYLLGSALANPGPGLPISPNASARPQL
jgi:hypothetical protein